MFGGIDMKCSTLEQKIIKILEKEHIPFEREKTFKDLRGGIYRFDFFFYLKGEKVVVELNGPQHYMLVSRFFKNRSDFLAAQERDRIKFSYCLANNINIFVIPFWEIDKVKCLREIIQEKYKVKNRWKNDRDWEKYKK